jgi:hypothetical protein
MDTPRFDIFSGQTDKNAVWVESVEGLGNASERMLELAQKTPGRYFVFCLNTHRVLASIDNSMDFGRKHQIDGVGRKYVHTMVFACPDCGLPVVIGVMSVHGNRAATSSEWHNIKCCFCEKAFRVVVSTAREHYIAVWEDAVIPLFHASGEA